jgi:predicted nucleic acid-binding Zn ribbon protein
MPLYVWKCTKCDAKKEVIRTFDGFRDPPTAEEAGEGECEHEWDKQIGTPKIVRGSGWGGMKGHWALALVFAAASLLSGCDVTAEQINKATVLCAPNGGLERILPAQIPRAICLNGAEFKI